MREARRAGRQTECRRGGWSASPCAFAQLAFAVCFTSLLALAIAGSARAVTLAYPDLRLRSPPGEISIGHPTPNTRSLQFSHITWNAGAGPLEIRPAYNPATGISQGFQALYSYAGGGTWKFNHLVPIVGPMIWEPPSDYRFPLSKFWLYMVGRDGGLGRLVAPSPKVDFCMTADAYVGGVPNTPSSTAYPGSNCGSPTGTLGLDVGWGDKYDLTDGGENIDITGLSDGNYWLREEVDPYHYLAESNVSNNITDTELSISADTVSVVKQVHPNSTPPTVTLSKPAAGTTVSGTVTLTATVRSPAPVARVQFLLDGEPLGPPVTSSLYSTTWKVGSTSPGIHYLSAQATDSRGFIGTAADVPVKVQSAPIQIGSIKVDRKVSATGNSSVRTPAFSTTSAGETLLAFVGSDGPLTGQTVTVSGGGLAWRLVNRANAHGGAAEIWTASARARLSGVTLTASASTPGYDLSLTAVTLTGASGIGRSAVAGADSGAPRIKLSTGAAGSALFAGGNDYSHDIARTLGPGQSLLAQWLDSRSGDTYWTQYRSAPSKAAGQSLTLNDLAPTTDMFNLVAVEVQSGPPPPAPIVSILNPQAAETLSGTIPLSANVTSIPAVKSVRFYVDGKLLGRPVTSSPYAIRWGTTGAANGNHTLTATAVDALGQASTSSPDVVTVHNPANPGPCFVMDANVSTHGVGAVTTSRFHTAQPGETLLALASEDGPASARQSVKIAGGGLRWTLVKRANAQSGDAEIWKASALHPLSNARVTSTPALPGYEQSLTVVAMQMSRGVGATASASARSGAPAASLTTRESGSLVFGAGNDWGNGIPRRVGVNQVLLHQFLDANLGNTFWAQNTTIQSGAAGVRVTLNDTAPAADRWNMAAVELLGDGPGQ